VRGRSDADAPSLALSGVVAHGSLRVGFLEGFAVVVPGEADVLLAEARRLDVDVLCWGGTGRFDAYEYGGRFFVNPGSATGAAGMGWGWEGGEEGTPSFCLMDVSRPRGGGEGARLIGCRSRASRSRCMCISSRRTRRAWRAWASRRSRSRRRWRVERTPVGVCGRRDIRCDYTSPGAACCDYHWHAKKDATYRRPSCGVEALIPHVVLVDVPSGCGKEGWRR